MYVDSATKIPDMIRLVGDPHSDVPIPVETRSINSKVSQNNIVAEVDNLFTGPFALGEIEVTYSGTMMSRLTMNNVIPKCPDLILRCCVTQGTINDIVFSVGVEKGGKIPANTSLIVAQRQGHLWLIVKDGITHRKIINKESGRIVWNQ